MLRNCGLAPWPPLAITGFPRPDGDGGAALVDVAVLRQAFQARLGVRIEARAGARPDAQDPSENAARESTRSFFG